MSTPFKTKPDFQPPMPRSLPSWTVEPREPAKYAGAHQRSDKATLAHVEPRDPIPGAHMPGEPVPHVSVPARRRIR